MTSAHHPLDLRAIDHVEFSASNARQPAHFDRTALGLAPVAYAGRETGCRDRASTATYGDTLHNCIERDDYVGSFLPGFQALEQTGPIPATGSAAIDHIVGNAELGAVNRWVAYYRDVLGFSQLMHFDDHDIAIAYSALMSRVMQNGTGKGNLKAQFEAIERDQARRGNL